MKRFFSLFCLSLCMGGNFSLYLQGAKGRKTKNNSPKYRAFDFLNSKITRSIFQKSNLKKEILNFVLEEKKKQALKDKKKFKKVNDFLVPQGASLSTSSLSPQGDIKFFSKGLSPNLSEMSSNDTDITGHHQKILQYIQEDDGFLEFKKNYSQFLKNSLKNAACQHLDLKDIFLALTEHFDNFIKSIKIALNTKNSQKKEYLEKNFKKIIKDLMSIVEYHLTPEAGERFPQWSNHFTENIRAYLLETLCKKDFFKECFPSGYSGNFYINDIQDSLWKYFQTFFLLGKRIKLSEMAFTEHNSGISFSQLKEDMKNKKKRIFSVGNYGDFLEKNYKMIYGENKHYVLLPNIGPQEDGKKIPLLTMISTMNTREIYKHFMTDFLIFSKKINNLMQKNITLEGQFFKKIHIFHGEFMEKLTLYKQANQDVINSIELESSPMESNEKTWVEHIRIYENEEFSLNLLKEQGFSLRNFFL